MNDNQGNKAEQNRIVNGYIADSRPWFAALGAQVKEEIRVKCGGALINHRFIL